MHHSRHVLLRKLMQAKVSVLILIAVLVVSTGVLIVQEGRKQQELRTRAQTPGTTYYVDCTAGNDSNNGTAQTSAWKTVTKANTATLAVGQSLLFKRGCTFTGPLTVKWSGTSTQQIIVGAYGTGELPILKTATTSRHPVHITGSYVTIENIHTTADAPAREAGCENNPVGYIIGFYFDDGSHHVTVQNAKASGLQAGADIRYGSHHNKILQSVFADNTMMSRLNNTNPNDDAGAFGIALHGDDNEIAYNQIYGSNACSYDYGRDGASVEVYGGSRNVIHHNSSWNSNAFSELGKSSTDTSEDNIFAYNTYTSTNENSVFLNTRGAGNSFGPIYRTLAYNNSVYVTGSRGEGIVCSSCAPDILTLRNNIIWAEWKTIYASGPFNESHNIYWKTGGNPLVQLQGGAVMSSTSKKVDPQFRNPVVDSSDEISDLHISPASPAINAGSTEAISKGFTKDIDDQAVPFGAVPDIGADEYAASNATPTPTMVVTAAPTTPPQPGQSYTFTAAGDTGADYDAREMFKEMGTVHPNFALHLGDMMYGHLASEPNPELAWCNFVKNNIGTSVPLQLISGNHEDMDNSSENYGRQVNKILPCLPNRITKNDGSSAITGKYGYEYYFDYPVANPIARHIQIAPYIMDETGDRYSYLRGTPHYTFVQNAINDAQAKGIQWIIVSMHHTCLSMRSAGCTSNKVASNKMTHLMNLLVEEKVDLILHGHIHEYQRSKQLSHSSGCPQIISETGATGYNSTCIADQGTTGTFTKGKGPVMVVIGTGGIGITTSTQGAYTNYFANWMGKTGSGDLTHGFGKFIVSEKEIRYTFESASWEFRGKTFTDQFTIRDASIPSIPPTGTGINFSITALLHGLGKGGDNVNPQGTGNAAPLHPQRPVTVELYNAENQITKTQSGTVTFAPGTGDFRGTVGVGTLTTGLYTVKLKIPHFLKKSVPGIVSIASGQSVTLPTVSFVTGDTTDDNTVSILDYNLILDCFSDLSPARNCNDAVKKQATDLTDDGSVNQFDYNLFLREISVQTGQ